jgi:WD40 repeat protein
MILWDLETGQELRKFVRAEPLSDFGSSCVAYFPDGRRAISCEQDGYFIEWDLQTGEEIRRFGPQASLRNRLSISPDGILAVSSGLDGSLMSWDSQSGELIRRTEGHGGIFNNALVQDGKSVFFGSSDRTIVQWELINPSLDELQRWIATNRYFRALTCEEQAVFQINAIDSDKCATGPNSP